jgi:hypothetical protein
LRGRRATGDVILNRGERKRAAVKGSLYPGVAVSAGPSSSAENCRDADCADFTDSSEKPENHFWGSPRSSVNSAKSASGLESRINSGTAE